MAKFNGIDLFGDNIRMEGPFGGDERTVVSKLPGVSGGRIYRMGRDTSTWTIRGRITRLTEKSMREAIEQGIRYKNGQVYTFTDNWGQRYDFCRLVEFRQITPFRAVRLSGSSNARGFTVEIQATIEWMSPDWGG